MHQLKTMFWLRRRLFFNQINHLSRANRIATWILLICALIVGVGMFFVAMVAGSLLLPTEPPRWLILFWDAAVLGFACFWMVGVMTELQRTEPLSLNNFLHLPIAPRQVFLLNYLTSLVSVSIIFFFPMMIGFSIAMIVRYGVLMLFSIVLIAAFFVMVTAVTYQFRGWLASIMVNKRRRRTVITLLTVAFILIVQIPTVLDFTVFRSIGKKAEETREVLKLKEKELGELVRNGELTEQQRDQELERLQQERDQLRKQRLDTLMQIAYIGNLVLPIGWLPLGIDGLMDHHLWVALLCFVGMAFIATISLARSYKTTLRMYRGGFVAAPKSRVNDRSTATEIVAEIDSQPLPDLKPGPKSNWIHWSIPLFSEHQSAVAATALRGMSRAPEVKLAILAPFLVMIVVGSTFLFRNQQSIPIDLRALTGIGVCSFAMLGVLQLIQNQMGYDRDGFRALLLAPIKERDILIGKNLGVAPVSLILGLTGLIAMQAFIPMRLTHFLATFIQLGTIYMVTCMIGNLMSIVAPIAVASGSMKPVNLKLGVAFLQFLLFFLIPICILPTMLPLLVEILLREWFGWSSVPVYLILCAGIFLATLFIYRVVVRRQGALLRQKKWDILDTVTNIKS